MLVTVNTKHAICSLFDVHIDDDGVQRITTPLEYPGTGDQIVIRVRPSADGNGYVIDENGEAAFYSSLTGGDVESEAVERWSAELNTLSPVEFTEDEVLQAITNDERLIAPYIFRVAEAAQQLNALATSKIDRKENDFKDRVSAIITEIAVAQKLEHKFDVELPIAGGLKADHVLGENSPLLLIIATTPTRLLEAEVIYMQYRAENKEGKILAIAESQNSVGKKQFERAGYYTDKTVIYNENAIAKLIASEIQSIVH